MKDLFIQLQRKIEMIPGVLRAGFCLHNRMVIIADTKSAADLALDETIWRAFADTIQVATLHKLTSPRMTWVFERVKVLCLISDKGTTLGVVIDKNSSDELVGRIERQFRSGLTRTVF